MRIEDNVAFNSPAQMTLGSAPDGVATAVKFDGRGVLDEGLPPNFDECLLERKSHRTHR
jgi:hypothetical protein